MQVDCEHSFAHGDLSSLVVEGDLHDCLVVRPATQLRQLPARTFSRRAERARRYLLVSGERDPGASYPPPRAHALAAWPVTARHSLDTSAHRGGGSSYAPGWP